MADADKNYEIKIRVNADVSQVEAVRRSFEKLGAQVQVTNLEAAKAASASAGAGAGNISELGRLVGQFTGVGIAGGILSFVNGLKQASAEIARVADDLDKQGAQLVKHAQLQGEAARHAKDQSDVLKISDAALKDIESTQNKLSDLSQKDLGYAAKISDYLQTQLLARQRAAQTGDYEAARQAELETASNQALSARQRGMSEVLAAEKALNQSLEEKVAIVNREIAAEEQHKQTAAANTDPGGYVKASNNLARLRKEREELTKLEEQERQKSEHAQEKAYGSASPQARAILRNEQAAREAKARGDDKSAEQFQASADRFKKSATPQDLESYQNVIKAYGEAPKPFDQIEQNKIDFEKGVGSQDFSGGASGKPSLIGDEARKAREASEIKISEEDARGLGDLGKREGFLRTAHESKQAAKDREETNARLRGENRAGEIERQTQDFKRSQNQQQPPQASTQQGFSDKLAAALAAAIDKLTNSNNTLVRELSKWS